MKKILFRVDASPAIGFGHLARCICLASYFRERSVESRFIITNADEKIRSMLAGDGWQYKVIKDESDICTEKNYSNLLVLDINNHVSFKNSQDYQQYLSVLKEQGFTTVAFEEFTNDVFPSDLVIIPYVGAETLTHSNNGDVKYLLGPDYFIFRDEFLRSPKISIRDKVENILICMGGTDPDRLTEKFIGFLINSQLSFHLNIVFAMLDTERHKQLTGLLEQYKGTYELFINPAAISSVMLASDIGIINSGLIKYETSLIGLPCISVSNNPEHEPLMQLFARKKMISHLGITDHVSSNDFSTALSHLVNNKTARQQLSDNALEQFDGKGKERIFSEIEKLNN